LETFFENDAVSAVSVRPIIERYADHVGINLHHVEDEGEKFREHTTSDLLKVVVEMDATTREKIFSQKVLNSLTILLELMAKQKLETIQDVQWFSASEENVQKFRSSLEKKGYVKKFNDAVMQDILGKDVEMKRKKNDDQVGAKSPVNIAPEVIQTKSRKVQLFPALAGAARYGIFTFAGLWSSILFAIFSVSAFSQHDQTAAINCYGASEQLAQQNSMAAVQGGATSVPAQLVGICDANANANAFGVVLVVLSLLGLIMAIIAGVKFVRIVLHNQFAGTHNLFELTHFKMTNG
jgi:hypothetical protein